MTDQDVGDPLLNGFSSIYKGNYSVVGAGEGFNGTNDQFNFLSAGAMADGSLTALVSSISVTDLSDGGAQAGLMFRDSSDPDALAVSIYATVSNGVYFQYRSVYGGNVAASQAQISDISPPVWLRLTRSSEFFAGFYSLDGTNWNQVTVSGAQNTSVPIQMGGTAQAGLAASSGEDLGLVLATFTNVTLPNPTFGVYRELWTNLTTSEGDILDILTNVLENPNWPNQPDPYYTHIFANVETEANSGWNNYGQRLRGFVVPPTNGTYTFWIASDNSSQLFLSPDESAGDMAPLSYVINYVQFEDWNAEGSQQSVPLTLQGGCRYYMEIQMEQGDGADNLSLRWQLPNFSYEQPMQSVSSTGTLIIPCDGVDTAPGIFTQSGSVSVLENQPVSFSVLSTNSSTMTYQWFNSNGPVAGATQSVLAWSNINLTANGQIYSCVLSNSVGVVTSAPVLLTVQPDTIAPVLSQVFNQGLTNVEILFSKPVLSADATNIVNYNFTNGLAILTASLASDNQTLTLTTSPLVYGSNYAITVNNIHDYATAPNVIATNTQAAFIAVPFVSQDIGSAPLASAVTYTSNSVVITGQSAGLNATDQANFQWQLQTGDFDVSVNLAGLSLADLWTEAGIMARVNLDADSPFAAAMATPSIVGEFFAERVSPLNGVSTFGSMPINFPNTWLRLVRSGNTFVGYGSYDGTNWNEISGTRITMPSQIYLGLVFSSHITNQSATADFINYGATSTNAVINVQVNPHEVLTASARRTGIVISEIMYDPAPRSDGQNVAFVELYNSNPFFQDISHYQLSCADMSFQFPANTLIPGGAFYVVAASPSALANVYGVTSNVFGPYIGKLKTAETLQLLDECTNILLSVPYTTNQPWPVAAVGTGHSIVLANPSYGEGNARAWDISDAVGGTPGALDTFHPNLQRSVVINEVLAHTENPAVPQFIELYNHSSNIVDLSGCILTDNMATNKFVIPIGTTVGANSFITFTQSQFNFTLNGGGDTLYFVQSNGLRVLDAMQFGGQADGVSYGRWPDGANDFYAFTTNTPGTNNSPILIGDIVINELMYYPISGNEGDQYIELYNKGTNTVDLAGWQFISGVTYTFPSGAVIAPNGYVVVGKNTARLLANYTNLNSGNTFGNYSGKLSHSGELVALAQPESYYGTNTIYVVEDEVTYGTGGRWGTWSDDGGSSLELIDPHSNHRLAANWADSDETQKSAWVTIQNTGILANGNNFDPTIDFAQMGILDVGECLVDNISVNFNGSNYVSNPDFESGGLTNWTLQGCLVQSGLENSGYQSAHSMHMRCADRFWTGLNSCEVALNANTMTAGSPVTLQYNARWLHGWPEPILRLSGNWLEATAMLPIPANLGTPGAPNSQYISNAGPAIYNVTHTPSLPQSYQNAVVTAQAHDPDGVQSLILYYRIDPATNYTAVTMTDDGTGGDAIAGDGVFSATIPGQTFNTMAAFYIAAQDNLGAATLFPANLSNNAPVQEAIVMFGDSNPSGAFTSYHLWVTQTNINRWNALSDLSNEGIDGTFVNNNRVIYNMQAHYAGSPFHQDDDSPVDPVNLCHYAWRFNDDDLYLGTTDFNKIHQPGNSPGDDPSLQREEIANTFLRSLGEPWLYKRYISVFVNGVARGQLMEDTQVPGSQIIDEHFPNDSGGFLYKMQPWFEMAPFAVGAYINFSDQSWCDLLPFTTPNGNPDIPRYRYNYEIRHTPDSASDFTNIISLVNAANNPSSSGYVSSMENIIDAENWMRVFAANHAAGNWDCFGGRDGQNDYGYIGTEGTKYTLLMWDFNLVIGSPVCWNPGQNLLTFNVSDPNIESMMATPAFLRMYWRALGQLVSGPLTLNNSSPLIEAKYRAFTENGFTVEDPSQYIEPWLQEAHDSIAAQLNGVAATNFSVNTPVLNGDNTALITGTAPLAVDTILINGELWPVSWTGLNTWSVVLPVAAKTNALLVQGLDTSGNSITGDSSILSLAGTDAAISPVGQIVINEIMYNPPNTNGQYVELYNNSSNYTFDLSGWQFSGLNYTFPGGSLLAPESFLVLAQNGLAFANIYGSTNPVFDIFPGPLPTNGQVTLTLIQPATNGAAAVTVTEVQYDSAAPWPAGANGQGYALELVDPSQDNWRVGNWLATGLSPDATNTVMTNLPAFPPLFINEVQSQNISSITNDAGQYTPWIELFNPSSSNVSLAGLYLTDDYGNLTNYVFPDGASIAAGQFEVVFIDGETNLSTGSEIHAGFTLSPGSGSIALSQVYNGVPQVLDYVNYTNIPPGYSFGSFPDGQSFVRETFSVPTPGASNQYSPVTSIVYSTVGYSYGQNFDSLPDPGSTTVQSANPVTIGSETYSVGDPFAFGDPISATGSGGLGLGNTLLGWYGEGTIATKVGASAGDQSTGGVISFGPTNTFATNRALGLIATSSTGGTAFGAEFLNATPTTLNQVSASFTGELWRQQPLAKTLSVSYYVDSTGTNGFPTNSLTALPALNVNFATAVYSPEDGTQGTNQTLLSVTNSGISPWAPGATFWLVWQMTNSAGNGQGLAIDNFIFSANSTLVPPIIVTQPQSLSVDSGNNPVFSVAVSSQFPVSYQWQFNAVNISGATNSTLMLFDVSTNDAGNYSVTISNLYGATLSSNALLSVNPVTGVPMVDVQPVSQTNGVGGTVEFSVSASGNPPLSYQWQFFGTNLPGATNFTLILSNLVFAQAGPYNVLISDAAGTVSSSNAVLTIPAIPPTIMTQPTSQTVVAGATVTESVSVNGTAPFTYQWMLNGATLTNNTVFSGVTTALLTISGVTAAQTGSYTVLVSNGGGTVLSAAGLISLVAPSYVSYTTAASIYTQNFDSLPDPGSNTVNTANPVTINGVTYGLATPFDFAYPVESTNGGLGLTNLMAGWYGLANLGSKLGASAGDQTTGGVISFGPTNSSATNRSLGLIATSTTGGTAFGLRVLNQTGLVLTNMNLSFIAELWRQQTTAKNITVSYYVDPTGNSGFSTNSITGMLTNLLISFTTGASASGTSAALKTNTLTLSNQGITNCEPGAALWLIWQMTNAGSGGQGMGIDNFSFSANGTLPPTLAISQSNAMVTLSWPTLPTGYVLQYNNNIAQTNQWANVGGTVTSSGQTNSVTLPITNTSQFFRLRY